MKGNTVQHLPRQQHKTCCLCRAALCNTSGSNNTTSIKVFAYEGQHRPTPRKAATQNLLRMQGNAVQQLPGAQLLASVVPRPNAAAMANLGLPSHQGNGMGAYTQQQLQQLSQMQGKQWAMPYIHITGTGVIVESVSQSVSTSYYAWQRADITASGTILSV